MHVAPLKSPKGATMFSDLCSPRGRAAVAGSMKDFVHWREQSQKPLDKKQQESGCSASPRGQTEIELSPRPQNRTQRKEEIRKQKEIWKQEARRNKERRFAERTGNTLFAKSPFAVNSP